jgi:hypothetical protein
MKSLFLLRFQKIFGITMILVFAITQTELKQFFKVPSLVQHFQEHKAKDENMSFADFLQMHYHGSDMDDSDNAKDQGLPFKSFAGTGFQISDLASPNTFVAAALSGAAEHNAGKEKLSGPQNIFAEIWQPPKIS